MTDEDTAIAPSDLGVGVRVETDARCPDCQAFVEIRVRGTSRELGHPDPVCSGWRAFVRNPRALLRILNRGRETPLPFQIPNRRQRRRAEALARRTS